MDFVEVMALVSGIAMLLLIVWALLKPEEF
jgi:hypothetical protein